MKWPDYHNRLEIDPTAGTTTHTPEQIHGLKQAHVAIKRHFARLGFRQVGRNSEQHHVFYLPACDYYYLPTLKKWKTKEEVQGMDIFEAPDAYEPTGVDATLHTLLQEEGAPDMDEVRQLLLTGRASLHGSRALFLAAANNDVPLLKDCLLSSQTKEEKERKVNQSDEHGNTPLHVAAMMMHLEVIQYLLDQGASKTARNDKLHTPLDTLQETLEAMHSGGDGNGDDEDDDDQDPTLAEELDQGVQCAALLKID